MSTPPDEYVFVSFYCEYEGEWSTQTDLHQRVYEVDGNDISFDDALDRTLIFEALDTFDESMIHDPTWSNVDDTAALLEKISSKYKHEVDEMEVRLTTYTRLSYYQSEWSTNEINIKKILPLTKDELDVLIKVGIVNRAWSLSN